jgi:hypothetical protein
MKIAYEQNPTWFRMEQKPVSVIIPDAQKVKENTEEVYKTEEESKPETVKVEEKHEAENLVKKSSKKFSFR